MIVICNSKGGQNRNTRVEKGTEGQGVGFEGAGRWQGRIGLFKAKWHELKLRLEPLVTGNLTRTVVFLATGLTLGQLKGKMNE